MKLKIIIGMCILMVSLVGCDNRVPDKPKTLFFSDHNLERQNIGINEELKFFFSVTNPTIEEKPVMIEVGKSRCIKNNNMYNFSFNRKFYLNHNVYPISDRHFYLDFKTTNMTVYNCLVKFNLYDNDKIVDSYSERFSVEEITCYNTSYNIYHGKINDTCYYYGCEKEAEVDKIRCYDLFGELDIECVYSYLDDIEDCFQDYENGLTDDRYYAHEWKCIINETIEEINETKCY